ncbi:MAG: hypothetical protein KH703_01910 [Campylobacter gracilis]|uniref:hypothetical protein n=1 Tax=Campylobacter gracilis TaxID=824 RepID=UPI0026ECB4A0|nr:hypothetical protein [Campylobacter gracilis]MBS6152161.1 hypothetical protein [Campylobacter gracilis]
MQKKREKIVKARGGIECAGCRKSGSQVADRKRVETKSSARKFTGKEEREQGYDQ